MTIDIGTLVAAVSARTGIAEASILAEVKRYNADFSKYGDEVYAHIGSRVAHWLNYNRHDWFAGRIDLYLTRLAELRRPLLIDIGYSVSYLQCSPSFSHRTDISAILVDKEQSAVEFYSILASLEPSGRQLKDRVVRADIETLAGQHDVVEATKTVVRGEALGTILIAASEIVEHLNDSANFWELARSIRRASAANPLIYVTLPIGEKIPTHRLAFATSDKAFEYLARHMIIDERHVLRPPNWADATPLLTACVCVFGHLVETNR